MMYRETCACGAVIELDTMTGPKRTEEMAETWRVKHRHRDPVQTGTRVNRKDEDSPWEVADDQG